MTMLLSVKLFSVSVATDGKDGTGLKLEQIANVFHVVKLRVEQSHQILINKFYSGLLSLLKFIRYIPLSFEGTFCV